jgi:hypothetical protein
MTVEEFNLAYPVGSLKRQEFERDHPEAYTAFLETAASTDAADRAAFEEWKANQKVADAQKVPETVWRA